MTFEIFSHMLVKNTWGQGYQSFNCQSDRHINKITAKKVSQGRTYASSQKAPGWTENYTAENYKGCLLYTSNREKVAQEIKTVANLYKKHLVLQADMLSDPEGGAHYADHWS